MSKHLSLQDELDSQSVDGFPSSRTTENNKDCFIGRICPPTRYVIAIWASIGFILDCALRINLSVAMVAMVNSTALHPEQKGSDCPIPNANNTTVASSEGEFMWDEIDQGYILGAFFWGYIPLQVPAGFLAERYGGKWLFGGGILWAGVLTLLTPLAARQGMIWLILLRALEGIGESVTYPAMSCLLGRWVPPMETSFLPAIALSGTFMGYVIGTLGSGYLIEQNVMGGWPSTFYVPGILTCIWFVCWSFVASNNPANHPRIEEKEREFIEDSIGISKEKVTFFQMPWKKIFLSLPVWAVTVANFCTLWSISTLLTCLPQYLFYIMGFSIETNGLLNSLPYFLMWVSFLVSCKSADLIRKHNILSTTVTRKVFNTIGMVGNAGFLLGVAYVGCDRVLAIVFLCAGGFIMNVNTAGFSVNLLDLAPQYAGTLYGIGNSIASIPGIVSPIIVGALTTHNQTREQWQKVFNIAAGVGMFGALFYLIFSSGERQPWAIDQNQIVISDSYGEGGDRRRIIDNTNNPDYGSENSISIDQ